MMQRLIPGCYICTLSSFNSESFFFLLLVPLVVPSGNDGQCFAVDLFSLMGLMYSSTTLVLIFRVDLLLIS
jgi:hypothetical protein